MLATALCSLRSLLPAVAALTPSALIDPLHEQLAAKKAEEARIEAEKVAAAAKAAEEEAARLAEEEAILSTNPSQVKTPSAAF